MELKELKENKMAKNFINELVNYMPNAPEDIVPFRPESPTWDINPDMSSEPILSAQPEKQQMLKQYLQSKIASQAPVQQAQQMPVEATPEEPDDRLAMLASGIGASLAGRNPNDSLQFFENKKRLAYDKEQNKIKLAEAKKQQDIDNAFREKQLSETINARKEIAAMQRADRQEMKNARTEQQMLEKAPQNRAAKLSGTDKARFDNALMAIKGIDEMAKALDNDQNTFSLVGDNDYTAAERRATEAYGRMQSGGAINKEEEERFRKTLPGSTDSKEIQRKKLLNQRDEMLSRLKTLGFTPEDLQIPNLDFNYGAQKRPKKVIQNGHEYILNEETGEYE